ncbi:MAG TPA: branched-chain amino acid ABC transporter substrate-binding protein [Candidatus Elarobacter sp.]|jgi:branched-chain amino acid transport system substrate-binding protein|nr:branched-chain amino acid ABC transporter substrate-binding protein [Candidatus Elarobacter sp.]
MNRAEFLGGIGGAAGATQIAQIAPYTATLRLAVVCPQSGPDARIGRQLADGVRAAVDQINSERSSFERALLLSTYDDHNTAADATVQANFAIAQPDTIAVIGHLSSGTTYVTEQTYAQAQVPLIVPTVTDDRITARGYRNVFRLPTKDSDEGRLVAAYAIQTGSKAPLVVTQDGDYGPDVARGFVQRAGSLHVNASLTQFSLDKPDFAAVAAQVLVKNPDCVTLAGNVGDMGELIGALRTKGYTGRFLATQGFFDAQTTSKEYAKQTEGLVVSTSVPYYPLAPIAQRDVQDYQLRYGALVPVSAFGYSAVQLVRLAARRTGATNRLAMIRALATGGSYDTITGSYTFGPAGDVIDPNCYFYRVKDGKFTYERQAHPSGFMLK